MDAGSIPACAGGVPTARALTDRVEPFLPITAPDFTFEESPPVQETLESSVDTKCCW